MAKLLNVGGGPVPVPAEYRDWDVDLLDIDLDVHPDIWMDARALTTLEPGQYDAVYCSHNMEHYYEHEVAQVLWGFYHILTASGFADIRVPDAMAVMQAVITSGLELDSVLYTAPVGKIRVCDVLWGWQKQIAKSEQPYYGHKFGFSRNTLGRALRAAHFEHILIGSGGYEIRAMAYKRKPKEKQSG